MCMHATLLESCATICDPMDCNLSAFPVHGILQVRIWEWIAMPFSRSSCQSEDQILVSYISCNGRWLLYHQHCLIFLQFCFCFRYFETLWFGIYTFRIAMSSWHIYFFIIIYCPSLPLGIFFLKSTLTHNNLAIPPFLINITMMSLFILLIYVIVFELFVNCI